MKKIYSKKGEVLIVLVIAFLIVTILASSALKISSAGLKVAKSYNTYSNKSYMAEKALNIIKAGIEEDCSSILEKEYDRMLDTYAYTPNSQRNLTFKEYYVTALKKKFIGSIDTPVDIRELFNSYIRFGEDSERSGTKRDNIVLASSKGQPGVYIEGLSGTEFSDDELFFTFKDVRVTYMDTYGFSSTVGADIVVETPMIFEDTPQGFAYDSGYADYILVADKNVIYDSSSTLNITGGVYGGDSIKIGETSNPVVNANSKYFHTRGDIVVYNGSTVDIEYHPVDGTDIGDVYAKNIFIEKHGTSTAPVNLHIKANTNVADDLEINAKGSRVELEGIYTGYSANSAYNDVYGNELVTEQDSSSLILNVPDSVLDLRNLTLRVLGTSSIIPPVYGNNRQILTNEAITAKFIQIVYTVPAVCISTLVNPTAMSEEGESPTIDYSKSAAAGGLDLLDPKYDISVDNPICVMIPARTDSASLCYYFLRFNSMQGQSLYVKDYIKNYEDYMNNKARTSLDSGRIIFGENLSYFTFGNALEFNVADGESVPTMYLHEETVSDPEAVQSYLNLTMASVDNANSLNATLMYNQGISQDSQAYRDGTFKTIIRTELFDEAEHEYLYYTLDDYDSGGIDMPDSAIQVNRTVRKDSDYDCIVWTNKNKREEPYVIPVTMQSGLVIANGDVVLNHSFFGLIIANGDIKIEGGQDLYNTNDSGEFPILSLLLNYSDQNTIQGFFRNFAQGGGGTEQSSSLKVKNLIRFDNFVVY